MNKAHNRINWENYPSDATPLNEANLNKIDSAVDEIDDRVIVLDTTKLDKVTAAEMVKDVSFNESTGVFTITYLNGSTVAIDTKLEKLIMNWNYSADTQQLILTLDDGTKQYVDLSSLITQYEFLNTETVAFVLDGTGKVSALVKEGSIQEKHLQPNYLSDIKVESAKAQASANAAATSETNAATSAATSENQAKNASASAETASGHANTASAKASAASLSAQEAQTAESNAKASKDNAAASAKDAFDYADAASDSASLASQKATESANSALQATDSEIAAAQKAVLADEYAKHSQSYAIGGTGIRENEDIENSKYYYEQTKQISQSLNGIIPQGTVAFAQLPTTGMQYGDMYNISDEFLSDERFNDGGGIYYGAGNNVIWVSGDKWDVTAGSGVTGVKGKKESTYRQGNVNITPENIGALADDGDSANNTVAFATASTRENIASGEKHSTIFGKITKWFSDLKSGAFATVVNNDTTTAEGYVADARIVKTHGDEIDALNANLTGKANASHGNHVPATQTADNKKFLRNDNTWQTVTPANIGAATSGHTHNYSFLELYPSTSDTHGGYIDFHYAGSSADHTSRIIESSSGTISINNVSINNGTITGNLKTTGGAQFPTDGNVYVNSPNNGCVGYLSNLLADKAALTHNHSAQYLTRDTAVAGFYLTPMISNYGMLTANINGSAFGVPITGETNTGYVRHMAVVWRNNERQLRIIWSQDGAEYISYLKFDESK